MTMHDKSIILLRHGIAEEHGSRANDDARELTDKGHRRMKEVAAGLAEIFPNAEAIYSSPLIRARQTAHHVAKEYDLDVTETDALRPGTDFEAVRKLINEASQRKLLLVGHEPHLTGVMLALTSMHADGALELKKGGCYRLSVAPNGDATLEWMLAPKVLRE